MADKSRTKEEKEEWEKLDPEERDKEYLPQKFGALRRVPAWDGFVKERFERSMVSSYTLLLRPG